MDWIFINDLKIVGVLSGDLEMWQRRSGLANTGSLCRASRVNGSSRSEEAAVGVEGVRGQAISTVG